jgi:hypothetical protein
MRGQTRKVRRPTLGGNEMDIRERVWRKKNNVYMINFIWIQFTIDTNWIICIFIFITPINYNSFDCSNSWFNNNKSSILYYRVFWDLTAGHNHQFSSLISLLHFSNDSQWSHQITTALNMKCWSPPPLFPHLWIDIRSIATVDPDILNYITTFTWFLMHRINPIWLHWTESYSVWTFPTHPLNSNKIWFMKISSIDQIGQRF